MPITHNELNERRQAIADDATTCPTCGGAPNAANFGGCCDACEIRRSARVQRLAEMLHSTGQGHTELGRALAYRVTNKEN